LFRGDLEAGDLGLALFTSAGGESEATPEVELELPKDWPAFGEFFGFEDKPSFRIRDRGGREGPYQLLEISRGVPHWRVPRYKSRFCEERTKVRVALDATVEPFEVQGFLVSRADGPTRYPDAPRIGIEANRLDNGHLSVAAAPDGTVSVECREAGR